MNGDPTAPPEIAEATRGDTIRVDRLRKLTLPEPSAELGQAALDRNTVWDIRARLKQRQRVLEEELTRVKAAVEAWDRGGPQFAEVLE